MTHQTHCPECDGHLAIVDPLEGEIVPCADCGVELEVITLVPLTIDLAPEAEEDWGE